MRRTTALIATLLAVVMLPESFGGTSFAQGVQTGTIRGTVVDEQGLPVPAVTIAVLSPVLQGVRTVVTARDGSYVFPGLPPGSYGMTFQRASFAPIKQTTDVSLGLTIEQDVVLRPAGVAEETQVIAELPAPIATPIVGANYTSSEINSLAVPRNLFGIAQLAPGLTDNTPNGSQITVNGSFAFDNIFMINGVDVNDNLLAQPQSLFIEDAIEETQVLTSGITAEYGRFTGGVVNAITRSGGNQLSGTFRLNLENPAWTVESPFERCVAAVTVASCRQAPDRENKPQNNVEATFGGPIIRDRLWFFAAGRRSKLETQGTLPVTNLANTQIDENNRAEIKVTGTVNSIHTFQGGYLANYRDQSGRPSLSFTLDPAAVGDLKQPNWYTFFSYRGVPRHNVLTEVRFSERRMKFDGGGTLTGIVDSPMITFNQAKGQYNAEFFDGTDPEDRNNRQFTANVMHFLDGGQSGHHELKVGYEFFRSQQTGGNSQSATNYVFYTDYAVDDSGNPLLDSQGRLQPVFEPGLSELEDWRSVRGAVLNVDNQSLYAQDHWVINPRLSADLGVRFEHIRSKATGGIIGLDTDSFVPRLALGYDLQGDGKRIVHLTYGWYSGRANEAQIGVNSNVGNPDLLVYSYVGPPGQGRNFAPGFNLANWDLFLGQFPTANIFVADDLRTALAKEFSASYGTDLMGGKGYAEAAYVHRNYTNLIEDFISTSNGSTSIVRDGVDLGEYTNIVMRNSDEAFREYRGLVFLARYNIDSRWLVNGHYTVQLRNNGNYEGEAASQPGIPSAIGDYVEAFTPARHWPSGRLDDFQRHKLRIWSIYNLPLRQYGVLGISGLWRVDSGLTYSLKSSVPLTFRQSTLIQAAGYVDNPGSQTIYFAERGSESFKGYGLFDTSVNYDVPVFRSLRPWVKFDVYNLFNNQKLIRWNTSVAPDPTSTVDSLGLPTGYVKGPSFGKGTATGHFPSPFQGNNGGGRTLRLAAGFRF